MKPGFEYPHYLACMQYLNAIYPSSKKLADAPLYSEANLLNKLTHLHLYDWHWYNASLKRLPNLKEKEIAVKAWRLCHVQPQPRLQSYRSARPPTPGVGCTRVETARHVSDQ